MSWSEELAVHCDEWSAAMTEDVPFYVELACEADGPLVELAVGNCRWATKSEWLGLADVAGRLEAEARHGSFDRRPLEGESREYVFVTRGP